MFSKIFKGLLAFLFPLFMYSDMHGEIKTEKATFAGGCFWCMEAPFEKVNGVIEVISGYTGGNKNNPTYEEVSSGSTGHAEAIQITYDPSKVAYTDLLGLFWRQVNPTDNGGQFVDRGNQYRTGIFYHSEEQKKEAGRSKEELQKSGRFEKPIVTEIVAAGAFYPAEEYHQDYYKKSPVKYKTYKFFSGREQYTSQVWKDEKKTKKSEKSSLKERLTPTQYHVTQENGTERPFDNEYWDNKKDGIYVDIVSGEALFSSKDKFKSGTGWPSFTKPLVKENVVEKEDNGLFMRRTEVRSENGDSHLGHVFTDGPDPTGLRYCINSASLRFIPKEELEKEGYGEYSDLFK